MSARVLVVSTYPAVRPRHGGQKRKLAIANAYRRTGFDVVLSAIFTQTSHPVFSPTDIPVSYAVEKEIANNPLTGDLICGRALTDDPPVRAAFERLLREFTPDVIHIEQPFLYPGVRRHLRAVQPRPILVYGSQNIEAPMKAVMLRSFGVPRARAATCRDEIHRIESAFARDCDLLAACTDIDLEHHRRLGARRAVLAPNGVERFPDTGSGFDQLPVARHLKNERFALFVGSAHPPNLVGYRNLVGQDLSFMPEGTRLVVAGAISALVARRMIVSPTPDQVRPGDPLLAGPVTEAQLRDLIHRAEVILLPITTGGGSNLKSAEAIAADRKVVASSHALRSFEWFTEYPNVWVADSREEFTASIRDAFGTDYVPRTEAQAAGADRVYWDSCLGDFMTAVSELVSRRSLTGVVR